MKHILNTSFHCHRQVAGEIELILKDSLCAPARSSDLFKQVLLLHIDVEVDPEAEAFALQLGTDDLAEAQAWLDKKLAESRLLQLYPGKAVYFTTPMTVL